MLQMCKEMELPQDANVDIEGVAEQIYDKYFKEKICDNRHDKSKSHLQDLLSVNKSMAVQPMDDDVWIFGYGSLVWKADFPHIDRRGGYICGYQRRFYQHSIDHRGTHQKPGRVVTLLPADVCTDRVYGMAYRIAAQHKHEVLQHLDCREKNGYERCTLIFHEFPETIDSTPFNVIMYIATHENDSYAGKVWQMPQIAEQIFTSAGPSGSNRDYLFNLANSMRILFPGVQDEHLFNLEGLVLKLIENEEAVTLERSLKKQIIGIVQHDKNGRNIDVKETMKKLEVLKNFCETPGWKEALLTKELLTTENS